MVGLAADGITEKLTPLLSQEKLADYRADGSGHHTHVADLQNVSPEPLVLIVEDDLGTRTLYREVLSEAGFRTLEAHNGFQALEKARSSSPNIVLTDLAVPGLDGFELGKALRQAAETRSIPILAVTGHPVYLDEPDRLREAGISHVLVKPCAPHLITEHLRRLLGGH